MLTILKCAALGSLLWMVVLFGGCSEKFNVVAVDNLIPPETEVSLHYQDLTGTFASFAQRSITYSTLVLDNDTAWIGSSEALIKYNLRSQEILSQYPVYDETVIPMLIDNDGTFLAAGLRKVYQVKNGVMIPHTLDYSDNWNPRIDVFRDHSGKVWVVGYMYLEGVINGPSFQLFQWENEKLKKIDIGTFPIMGLTGYLVVSENEIWIAGGATNSVVISKYDGSKWIVYDSDHDPIDTTPMYWIDKDAKGDVYFVNPHRYWKFDGAKWIQLGDAGFFTCFYADILWAIQNGRIFSVSDSMLTEKMLAIPSNTGYLNMLNGFLRNYRTSIFQYGFGENDWVVGPGVDSGFTLIGSGENVAIPLPRSVDGLPGSIGVTDILTDRSGQQWISTDSIGILLHDQGEIIQTGILAEYKFSKLHLDSMGTVWCISGNTLYAISSSGKIEKSVDVPLTVVRSLSFGTDNSFVAAGTGGVVVSSASGMQVYTSQNSGLPTDMVTTAVVDRNGEIVIGTDRGGICIVRDTGIAVLNQRNSRYDGSKVHTIVVDNDNNKWIVSDDSIYLLIHDSLSVPAVVNECYTKFVSKSFLNLIVSDQNEIWMTFGTRGVGRYGWDSGVLVKLSGKNVYSRSGYYSAIAVVQPGKLLLGSPNGVDEFSIQM